MLEEIIRNGHLEACSNLTFIERSIVNIISFNIFKCLLTVQFPKTSFGDTA